MKRLTTNRSWEEASKDLKHELGYSYVWKRLKEIEDILGDDYDLDRLKVIVNQRMTMREEVAERFRITKDVPVERISEMVEADRDGRCVILPTNIYTNEDAKKALERAMFSLKIADTGANRFTVQVITEKIIEEGYDESIWGRNK